MDERDQWVLLAYRLPREPSTPRINLWRRLRRLGVAQILDGLVGLPLDRHTREQIEWLADEVIESGGEASVWIAQTTSVAQSRALSAMLHAMIVKEYATVIEAARAGHDADASSRRRLLRRLRAEMRRIRSRDYSLPAERTEAERALEELAALAEVEG